MKRTWTLVLIFMLCFVFTSVLALMPAKASPETASISVNVDHSVEIRNGGMLVVNDTVQLSIVGESSSNLTSYLLGFPYGYQTNLTYAFAYETSNPTSRLKLEFNVGMGRVGLFGVNVVFPPGGVDISNGKLYEFTVVFVFSNSITSQVLTIEETKAMYNASFPAYPSLADAISEANVTIIFPTGLDYMSSSYDKQGINFTRTTSGSKQSFSFAKGNLSEFSSDGGWFATTKATGTLELLDVDQVTRVIEFSGLEQIVAVDTYSMTSRSDTLQKISVNLPRRAFDISASTETADIPSSSINSTQMNTYTALSITFPHAFAQKENARFAVNYKLPWNDYVSTENWQEFKVSLTLLEIPEWIIKNLTVTVDLPEGARLITAPSTAGLGLDKVQNRAFSSSLIISVQNVTRFRESSLQIEYGRTIFWESFRPTLWTGSLVVVVAGIAVVWSTRRPVVAPLPTGIAPIRVEDLKNFVDLYDERRRLLREVESLEAQASKGKIPRRRYRVRKMTAEGRLSALSRDMTGLRSKINSAGPRYADLMRQLELAEAELESVTADISRTEIRYRRGEISAAAYHRLLEDYYRRRDRAGTTIDGVLLRLREEIS